MLVSRFAEPGHGGALRSFDERLDERRQEGVFEIVPGQRLDCFSDECGRQCVETNPKDINAGTDMDQRDFGTLARSDLDGSVKRTSVPDDFALFVGNTLVL